MTTISRRHLLQMMGGATALAMTPTTARSAGAAPHVVVVGGGFAGATAARYLRHWSANTIDVTLVESNPDHVSCILSNLVLNGRATTESLTFSYDRLVGRYGVRVVQDTVQRIQRSRKRLVLKSGNLLPFDRLVLAPGITFDPIPGLKPGKVPHAWKAGKQTDKLRRQIQAMPDGGTFVMTIPPAPYRCPPGPYERACVVADIIEREKGGGRVVVLDANPGITAEKHTFETAFNERYAGIVEYLPGVTLDEVDSTTRTAYTSAGVFESDVLNVIPPHRAPKLLKRAGLLDVGDGRWAGVDPISYESTVHPDIHVIGDSQGTGQPKAGHIANAEAKVCADAILRMINDIEPDPNPTTNSACFSPITYDTASWLTAAFRYDPATRSMVLIPESFGEARRPSGDNFEKMYAWSENLFADTFG